MAAKQIEMLHEIVPKAEVMGVMVNPTNRIHESQLTDLQTGARVLKIWLSVVRASTEQEIEKAFASVSQQGAGAAIIPGEAFFMAAGPDRCAGGALFAPTVFEGPSSLGGGADDYGAGLAGAFRDLANYTGRILKGARPEDLPVEQTTKFEMVINLKTAKALGLTIPQSILARADKLIE